MNLKIAISSRNILAMRSGAGDFYRNRIICPIIDQLSRLRLNFSRLESNIAPNPSNYHRLHQVDQPRHQSL
tara:strand:+ start:1104 stop:1316 length:213 start_codon:yes stop_codon:yes gene_type:complete